MDCVTRAKNRTDKNLREKSSYRPFHTALLTEAIVRASSFERSFSTSFGQGPIEDISKAIALDNGFGATRQAATRVNVYKGAVDEIERICSSLRDGRQKPNWVEEVAVVKSFHLGDTVVRKVNSDLKLTKNGVNTYISIKTVKPNLDQSEKAKKDMLLLNAGDPVGKTYFALYYNPYGESKKSYQHSTLKGIFDIANDDCILLGKEYWDFLGGKGTYEELIEDFEVVGIETRKMLLGY